MFAIRIFFVLLALQDVFETTSAQGVSTCKTCMENMVYCVDETHFYLCLDGKNPSMTAQPQQCPQGTFCTNSTEICAVPNPPQTVTACASSSGCSKCSGQFACVSQTQFALCKNNELTSTIVSCDQGQVCSTELFNNESVKRICAPQTVLQYLGLSATCSNTQTTTVAPTAAPDQYRMKQQCEAAEGTQTNRFYYVRDADDTTCRSYIYCERINNQMEAVPFMCKTGYYDSTSKSCVQTKPKDC